MRGRLKRDLVHRFFLRWHMTVLMTGTVAAGVLAGKALLLAGLGYMPLRWGLAVLVSYLAFFGLVRLWVAYMDRMRRGSASSFGPDLAGGLDGPPVGISIGGSGGEAGGSGGFHGGGGQMGGGGASASFEGDALPASGGGGGGGGGKGSWFGGFDLDLDGEGILVLIALAILVLGIVIAGGYVIYLAPDILSEVAFQTVLAGPLARRGHRLAGEGWTGGVLRATWLPFLIMLVVAAGAGALAHWACPAGATVLQKLARCT